jgi:exopolysaccharide biosynthesis polyprenyl glycosylphosphotransferase
VLDVGALLGAYSLATVARADWVVRGNLARWVPFLNWSLLVMVVIALATFACFGLYRREVFVSRPLHVVVLAKACVIAFGFSAVIVYLVKSPDVTQSRFIVVGTFLLAFVFTLVLRLAVLTPILHREAARRRARSLVIGGSPECERLTQRLSELRGFASWRVVDPGRPEDGYERAFEAVTETAAVETDGWNVFIDAGSILPESVLALVADAKERNAEVFVVSRLLTPLDSTRLLLELFEMPVVRVRELPGGRGRSWPQRAFDIVSSTVALVALSPILLTLAVAVKRSSPGPVFFIQERVGFRGTPFRFYKFRSMEVGDDDVHRDYVCAFIDGEEVCVEGNGDADRPYKIIDHPRLTRIGTFMRKYSLDELPQLWNVLKGDMSIVGPRPALGYEVEHYKEWHRRRLAVIPGISGVWQVSGRSRVGFDEMVLEDILYTCNQSLMTDVAICLRTVPVVLLGRGGG